MTLDESCRQIVALTQKLRETNIVLEDAVRERAIAIDALKQANEINAGLVRQVRNLERRGRAA